MVRSRLQIADRLQHEVEARVKRELLEQVVVEACARRDPHAARTVERQTYADACLRGGAQDACSSLAGRSHRRGAVEHVCEPLEQEVVVLAVTHVEADAVREDTDDEPAAQQRFADALRFVERQEQEIRSRRQGFEPERAQRARHALAFLDLVGDVG